MTQSIDVTVQTDDNVLTELLSQDQEAGSDREVALRLGGQIVPPRKPSIISSAETDEELLAKLSARYISSPAPSDESGCPENTDNEDESGEPASTSFGPSYWHSKKRRFTACQEYQEYQEFSR